MPRSNDIQIPRVFTTIVTSTFLAKMVVPTTHVMESTTSSAVITTSLAVSFSLTEDTLKSLSLMTTSITFTTGLVTSRVHVSPTVAITSNDCTIVVASQETIGTTTNMTEMMDACNDDHIVNLVAQKISASITTTELNAAIITWM